MVQFSEKPPEIRKISYPISIVNLTLPPVERKSTLDSETPLPKVGIVETGKMPAISAKKRLPKRKTGVGDLFEPSYRSKKSPSKFDKIMKDLDEFKIENELIEDRSEKKRRMRLAIYQRKKYWNELLKEHEARYVKLRSLMKEDNRPEWRH